MSDSRSDDGSFLDYLEKRHIRFNYKMDDFLYGHVGPCPQPAPDHPFGQAPEVLNIPKQEWDDWQKHVGNYYESNKLHFAEQAAEYSWDRLLDSGLLGYPEIGDTEFSELLSEGLYSKFICPTLDPPDEKRFAEFLKEKGKYDYFKSDYSCMKVIERPWKGEYVAPTVVLLRKPKGNPYGYEAIAIALSYWDETKETFVELTEPLTKDDGEAWRLAKYFVLQGAVHRINLIDHTKDHFPYDAINAITKTVLPKRNLVFQLLIPHLWLQLPVNNTVLEADRSLISRKSWYPWSPFVAKGPEVRKLLPFGWYGGHYYWKERNSAYPPYRFELQPRDIPSRYGAFFKAYFEPIRAFVGEVVSRIPPDDGEHTDWIEIQSWADQISRWIPGFPTWQEIKDPDTLADTLAVIILNVAVIHSSDHATVHKIMNEKPVPFILRVPPPKSESVNLEIPKEVKGFVDKIEKDLEEMIRKQLGDFGEQMIESFIKTVVNPYLAERLTLLCYPWDLISARLADLLFYLPHNSSLLIDCDYAFAHDGPLTKAVAKFQEGLRKVDREQQGVVKDYGFPRLEPDPGLKGKEREKSRERDCIGAGVQY